jgi:hypothetical protein
MLVSSVRGDFLRYSLRLCSTVPLNFSPYIPLTCHISVLFPPISQRSTVVPPISNLYTPPQQYYILSSSTNSFTFQFFCTNNYSRAQKLRQRGERAVPLIWCITLLSSTTVQHLASTIEEGSGSL